MADDRTAAHGELGMKSLQAKKLAKDAGHLGTLVLSLDTNLEAKARELGKGPEATAIVEAGANLGSAIRALGEASENLNIAGATLERAGSPLYHYSYDRSAPEPGDLPWAPKVVAVGGIPIEEYARLRGFAPSADVDHDFKSLLDKLVRTMTSDIKDLSQAAEQVGRLDGGPAIARELHNLAHALQGQVKMVGEEVGKFTTWVDANLRKGG